MAARILAFAGSARKHSFNRRLVGVAAEVARSLGAEVSLINLGDLNLPIFDEDAESAQGLPPGARKLKDLMIGHDGFLLSCPEYNSSITPMLKNAIDWASRPVPGESPLACFKHKTCALLSASSGALGGLRGLVHVRAILGNIGAIVLPDQFALAKGHEAFDEQGRLKDEKHRAAVEGVVKALVSFTGRLKG
ncbi:MAG: NAD(P)H-dependent oxidoreductase [Phycisphaerales bacterium]|nr:NAD(P)H-dependent oxidoreductase [Phycisphaerales bacterium]